MTDENTVDVNVINPPGEWKCPNDGQTLVSMGWVCPKCGYTRGERSNPHDKSWLMERRTKFRHPTGADTTKMPTPGSRRRVWVRGHRRGGGIFGDPTEVSGHYRKANPYLNTWVLYCPDCSHKYAGSDFKMVEKLALEHESSTGHRPIVGRYYDAHGSRIEFQADWEKNKNPPLEYRVMVHKFGKGGSTDYESVENTTSEERVMEIINQAIFANNRWVKIRNANMDTNPPEKVYKVKKTKSGASGTASYIVEGTLEELIRQFRDTLDMGHQYDSRVNLHPKTIRTLINSINRALNAKGLTYHYEEVELVKNPPCEHTLKYVGVCNPVGTNDRTDLYECQDCKKRFVFKKVNA